MRFVEPARPYILFLFRVVVGLLFACHGAAKLFGVFGSEAVRIGAWPDWFAGVIELVGGTLVLLGLVARIAALVCSGEMAYAYFVVHQPSALWPLANGGEPAVLYAWSFLLIAVVGPGAWAIDTWLGRARVRVPVTPSEVV
ncbi:DoxX family protein [Streptosporangium sp. NPDC051022]|uniref:DoxX family protein n=1 Tax=Streptosporangium sp. NPDC051022 TaxID=3155752 RepID=UPI00342BB142